VADIVVVEATDQLSHVAVKGRLDVAGVGEVELKLTIHTTARRKPAIVDLTEVNVLASIGIGMLVAIGKSMKAHHLGFAIVASGTTKDILEKVKVDTIFPVVATYEQARTIVLGG